MALTRFSASSSSSSGSGSYVEERSSSSSEAEEPAKKKAFTEIDTMRSLSWNQLQSLEIDDRSNFSLICVLSCQSSPRNIPELLETLPS